MGKQVKAQNRKMESDLCAWRSWLVGKRKGNKKTGFQMFYFIFLRKKETARRNEKKRFTFLTNRKIPLSPVPSFPSELLSRKKYDYIYHHRDHHYYYYFYLWLWRLSKMDGWMVLQFKTRIVIIIAVFVHMDANQCNTFFSWSGEEKIGLKEAKRQ